MLRTPNKREGSMGRDQLSKPYPLLLCLETWIMVLLIPGQCCDILHASYSEGFLPVCHLSPKQTEYRLKDLGFFIIICLCMCVFCLFVCFSTVMRGYFWNPQNAVRMGCPSLTAPPGPPDPGKYHICNGHIRSCAMVPSAAVIWLSHHKTQGKNTEGIFPGYISVYLMEVYCFLSATVSYQQPWETSDPCCAC